MRAAAAIDDDRIKYVVVLTHLIRLEPLPERLLILIYLIGKILKIYIVGRAPVGY